MATTLPLVPSVPWYRVGTTLETVHYLLDVRWNSRDSAWYMDVLAQDETPIVVGLKLVLGVNLGQFCTDPLFQNGMLRVTDTSGQGLDAGFDDLGARVVVTYAAFDDLIMGGVG